MRSAILMISLVAAVSVFSQSADTTRDCPECDLPLKGFTIGAFFGGGTFSADTDSPTVSEEMGIDEMPTLAMRAGGGLYFYPGGRYRIGLLGGYNRAGAGEGDKYLRAEAFWGALATDLIRTTGAFNITGGIGAGGGIAKVTGCELGSSAEGSETSPMFALLPRFGFELALGETGALSLEFSYLWFFGEDQTVQWDAASIGEAGAKRQFLFSPIDIGGPSLTLGLQLGRIQRLRSASSSY